MVALSRDIDNFYPFFAGVTNRLPCVGFIVKQSANTKIRPVNHTIIVSDKSLGGDILNTQEAVAHRIKQLCKQKGFTPNKIAIHSAVPQATLKSILNGESKNPGVTTIKKLCDGFEMTLGEFFNTPLFDSLEQEIK